MMKIHDKHTTSAALFVHISHYLARFGGEKSLHLLLLLLFMPNHTLFLSESKSKSTSKNIQSQPRYNYNLIHPGEKTE